ncbi:hypothetical protein J4205_00325 [Candidatus Pacearchaeota archaeon]|nr:hypothetical protein [Candidatus Pacearchaeota archaeon]
MIKRGWQLYLVLAVFIIVFSLTLVSAQWDSSSNPNGNAQVYNFDSNSKPMGVEYFNGMFSGTPGSALNSTLYYVPFIGSRETILIKNKKTPWLGTHYEYVQFDNPSISIANNRVPFVAFTKSTLDYSLFNKKITRNNDYEFIIKYKTGSGNWIFAWPDIFASGPDNPCFDLYSWNSMQRIAVDANGDFHAVYKTRGATTLIELGAIQSNCENKINSYITIGEVEREEILDYNFEQRFNWGGGIQYVHSSSNTLLTDIITTTWAVDMPVIALDSNNKAHFIYVEEAYAQKGALMHAYYNVQGGIIIEKIDDLPSAGGPKGIGKYHIESLSAVINPTNNKPAVLYYKFAANGGQLYYVYYNNGWQKEIVKDNLVLNNYYPGAKQASISIGSDGKARISFIDNTGNLIYLTKTSGAWTEEVVNTLGQNNYYPSFIFIDSSNNLNIANKNKYYYKSGSDAGIGGVGEICNNLEDEDGDALIDCADIDCNGLIGGQNGEICEYNQELTCNDLFDNDRDGLIDALDSDCTSPKECSDTLDNDGDGLTDFPNDLGCIDANDNDETDTINPNPNCGNGVVDLADGEECDDGNIVDGDGCSSSCLLEFGASCNSNGIKETGEICDGNDLNGETCISQGYESGNLLCNTQCGYDTSECDICGDEICSGSENSETCPADCITFIGEISCAQYTSESSCNSAILTDEINNTIEAMNPQFQSGFCGDPSLTFTPDSSGQSYSEEACGSYLSCKCKWFVDKEHPDGICDGITKFKRNNPMSCGTDELTDFFCRTTGSGDIGSCIAGNEYTLTWTAQAYDTGDNPLTTPVEWCQSGSKNFPCPSSSKIPFFTALNVIIALIVIGIVYYIIINKRRNKPLGKFSKTNKGKNHKKK